MAKDLIINGRTFVEFCFVLRGKRIFSRENNEIFKFELFQNGINPNKLLALESKNYIIKNRKECT